MAAAWNWDHPYANRGFYQIDSVSCCKYKSPLPGFEHRIIQAMDWTVTNSILGRESRFFFFPKRTDWPRGQTNHWCYFPDVKRSGVMLNTQLPSVPGWEWGAKDLLPPICRHDVDRGPFTIAALLDRCYKLDREVRWSVWLLVINVSLHQSASISLCK